MCGAPSSPGPALVVGPDAIARPLRAKLRSDIPETVNHVPTIPAACSRLGDRSDVDCVVLAAEAGDVFEVEAGDADGDADREGAGSLSAAAACDAVRETDPNVPILVSVPTVRDETATALAARGDCRLLPRSATEAETVSAVRAALDSGSRRRRTAVQSSVFEHVLGDGDVHLFVLDEEGRYLYRTPTPSWPHEGDPIGKTPVEYLGDEFEDQTERMHRDNLRVIGTGEPILGAELGFDVDGTEFWLRTTKLPWRAADGSVEGMIGVSFEVTEYKRDERRLATYDERLGQFSNYVAHELRTPLQISLGMLDRARDGDERAFEKLERANEWMEGIVSELGALSTPRTGIETGYATADRRPSTRLRSLVESVWAVLETERATLTCDLDTDTTVVADRGTLRLVVENVLKNALEHGGPDVRITVGTVDDGFFVADDGPSVPTAARRSDPTVNDGSEGLEAARFDIGLRIAEGLVTHRGWSLSASNPSGGGARFEITGCRVIDETPSVATGEGVVLESSADVGAVGTPGRAEYNPDTDTWIVAGAGRNLWGNVNEFHFAWGEAADPVRIECKISDFDPTIEHSKAGLMIRDGIDPDRPFHFLGREGEDETELLSRSGTDERTRSHTFDEPLGKYDWYRLDCVDGVVTCYASRDAEEWDAIDRRSLPLDGRLLVGLAVCGMERDTLSEAVFANVRAVELRRE